MSTKQIHLNGTETVIDNIKGYFVIIGNFGQDVMYAALSPNISENMEQATPIQPYATKCIPLPYNSNKVYLLGSGTAIIKGTDDPCEANDSDAKSYVDRKIAETAKYVNGVISSPNLIINPDFKVNQRRKTNYSDVGYTVDRWHLSRVSSIQTVTIGSVTPCDAGVQITSGGSQCDTYFRQYIENAERFVGQKVTLSLEVEEMTGTWSAGQYGFAGMDIIGTGVQHLSFEWNEHSAGVYAIHIFHTGGNSVSSIKIKWVKLEYGSTATQFTPPDPATELLKCQRYYQIRSTGTVDSLDLCPTMRTSSPTVSQTANGWEYDSEINP